MTTEVARMLEQGVASGNADAVLRAGAAALQAGAQDEALAPVRAALDRHPSHPQLWHLLGLLHRGLEDLGPSVEAFARASELAPYDAAIAHARACVNYEAGLPAEQLFARAIELAPSDKSIRLRHAAAQVAEGRVAQALAGLDQALRRDPAWVEGHAALARLRFVRGGKEGFDASFERASDAAPRDTALWRGWIELLLKQHLFERALTVIARARAAAGQQRVFDEAEAMARSELGEIEAAGVLFRRLAPLKSIPILVAFLRFLLRTGRIDEAAQLAERAAPADPSHEIWPYLSIIWRLRADSRWSWLEGDPAFIGVYDIAWALAPIDALADRLRTLHASLHEPLGQSLRGGTQTEHQLFSRVEPEIRQLRRAVHRAVERHVDRLPPARPGHPLLIERRAPIRFSGSWSVRLAGGGRHVNHVHPAGWLSSALYVALPGEADRGTGEAGWLALGEMHDLGIDMPPIRVVEPKPGRLVLFPSTMWHGTRPFDTGERLTVAFDVKRPG